LKTIVFVIESLHLGGAEKSLVTLLGNLDYSKYNIDLITFKENGPFRELVPNKVNYINLSFPKLTLLDRTKFFLKRKLKTKQHNAQVFWSIVQNRFNQFPKTYDIAIAYNQGFSTYFVGKYIIASKKYSWLNTDYKKAGYNISFDYPIYKKFNKIIVVSPESNESFKRELKSFSKELSIAVIKDITDNKAIKLLGKKPLNAPFNLNKINIVSVGRLVTSKGFHLAIKSCKILLDKDYPIKWYLVGEGSERKNLQKLINENHLENHFFLIGADSNPYPYMKNATIYVQTSLFEGLGLTVVEANYLNKPIVSTNFPTVHGILKAGKTGLIAKMNAKSIANQIEILINDVPLREKFIKNSSMEENNDKEETLKKINNLLNY
jgi:glycosyltransferase involved in cell wall biosynthesis|tara:strand:- start:141 stop:1274 length:1134 start_codon:yes stop_codon:yes gene_type:complete